MKTNKPNPRTPQDTSKEPLTQAENKSDVEWRKLELERQRLQFEIESSAARNNLETERLILDKAKERTIKLQILLPVGVSVLALLLNSYAEYRRAVIAQETELGKFKVQAAEDMLSGHKYERRMELFRRLAEKSKDVHEVMQVYREVFPDAENLDKKTETAPPIDADTLKRAAKEAEPLR